MATNKQLLKAIKILGGATSLAKKIGTYPQKIDMWVKRGSKVPGEYCAAIEVATDGKVTAEQLRPDVFKGMVVSEEFKNELNSK